MRKGFTLIEVLLAMLILAILGAIVARALADQADLSRRVQARNEVQDKARVVMELVKQDLFLAGSSRYVTFSGSGNSFAAAVTSSVPNWTACSTNPCLSADSANSTTLQDRFSVRYVTSLRDPTQACRRVTYTFTTGNILQRSDVTCNNSDNPQPLADQVLALNVRFECSDGGFEDTGSPPCSGNRYPRAALVTVVVASNDPAPGNPSEATAFTIPTGSSTQTVSCPPRRICYALTDRVELPSLKDK